MRTRRSPRNQDRLFKELFAPKSAQQSAKASPSIEQRAEQITQSLDKPWIGRLYRGELERELARIQAILAVRRQLREDQ